MIFAPPILRPGIFRHAFGVGRIASAGKSLDPATRDYLSQIKATGQTVTPVQESAIDAFFVKQRASGRYDMIGQMNLPIWGTAAANAICMKSQTVGVFINSPIHGAGWVEGTGPSYFDPGAARTLAALGIATANSSIWMLQLNSPAETSVILGCYDSTPPAQTRFQLSNTAASGTGTITMHNPALGSSLNAGDTIRSGIFVGSNPSTSLRFISRRTAAGVSYWQNAVVDTTPLPNTRPFVFRRSNMGVPDISSVTRLGFWGWGRRILTQAEAEDFSLDLKTLWETCTGQTIP